jgi:hypothetical protein
MSTMTVVWLGSAIAAFMLLPVGAIRLLAYRSGSVDHTPTMRAVALLALGLGTVALVLFAGLSVWLLVAGERPL